MCPPSKCLGVEVNWSPFHGNFAARRAGAQLHMSRGLTVHCGRTWQKPSHRCWNNMDMTGKAAVGSSDLTARPGLEGALVVFGRSIGSLAALHAAVLGYGEACGGFPRRAAHQPASQAIVLDSPISCHWPLEDSTAKFCDAATALTHHTARCRASLLRLGQPWERHCLWASLQLTECWVWCPCRI